MVASKQTGKEDTKNKQDEGGKQNKQDSAATNRVPIYLLTINNSDGGVRFRSQLFYPRESEKVFIFDRGSETKEGYSCSTKRLPKGNLLRPDSLFLFGQISFYSWYVFCRETDLTKAHDVLNEKMGEQCRKNFERTKQLKENWDKYISTHINS